MTEIRRQGKSIVVLPIEYLIVIPYVRIVTATPYTGLAAIGEESKKVVHK